MSIRKALRLDHWEVKSALRHPLLEGKKPIGRGCFSAIFEGTRKNTVLKLTVDDIGYWLFNCWATKVEHRHFPRIIDRHGDIGTVKLRGTDYPLFLFEMEKLEKIKPGTDTKRLAMKIQNTVRTASNKAGLWMRDDLRSAMMVQHMMQDTTLPRSIRNALGQLKNFCCNYPGGQMDLHINNMMQRKNGELVITDPLANMSIWRKAVGRDW